VHSVPATVRRGPTLASPRQSAPHSGYYRIWLYYSKVSCKLSPLSAAILHAGDCIAAGYCFHSDTDLKYLVP